MLPALVRQLSSNQGPECPGVALLRGVAKLVHHNVVLHAGWHGTHQPGSDGTIAGKRVEVKTISPEKSSDSVLVKRQGDFEQLLIVRIDEHFEFTGKLINREDLSEGEVRIIKARLRVAGDPR